MTAREPDARPTAGEVAEELARVAAGGTATTVLAAATTAQPVVDRTQVLSQTRVAPVAAAPAVPVARPVSREALPVAERDDGWKWALALVAVIAVLVGGAALAGLFDKGSGRTPAAVSETVPGPVATTLRNLQREVQQAGRER